MEGLQWWYIHDLKLSLREGGGEGLAHPVHPLTQGELEADFSHLGGEDIGHPETSQRMM